MYIIHTERERENKKGDINDTHDKLLVHSLETLETVTVFYHLQKPWFVSPGNCGVYPCFLSFCIDRGKTRTRNGQYFYDPSPVQKPSPSSSLDESFSIMITGLDSQKLPRGSGVS